MLPSKSEKIYFDFKKLSDLQSYRSERPELRWSHLRFHNQQYKLEPPAKIKKSDLHNEGELLPVKAHTEILAEQFLAGGYQSHRADPKTTSTSFLSMRLTLNDSYMERLKEHTNNKEQLNCKEYKNARAQASTDTRSILS